jgi:PQQ-like domain
MNAFVAFSPVPIAVSCLIVLWACSSEQPQSGSQGGGGVASAASGNSGMALSAGGELAGALAGGGVTNGGNQAGATSITQAGAAGAAGVGVLDPWHDNWPQAGGPEGTWRVSGHAPTSFSVSLNQNILWQAPLPGGGQGGIAVWGDRLFLTTFEPYTPGASKMSATILGHALDATTGKVLWSVKLTGTTPSPMMYAYSDSTSWTPITDGSHVWFFNSSGEMGCWDFNGKELWRRSFPAPDEPFNKQHEPFLAGDAIVSAEPLVSGEPGYSDDKRIWNYLRGIDKLTGKTLWISQDALTHYATAVSGRLANGDLSVLQGRGGPHSVPERPIGLTLSNLQPGHEGESLWRFEPEQPAGTPAVDDGTTFEALYTMTWDEHYAYAFRNAPEEAHLVIDIATGKLLRTQSLAAQVDVRQWDLAAKKYVERLNVSIRDVPDSPAYALSPGQVLHVHPNWHANLAVDGYHYFSTMTNNRRNDHAPAGHSGPAHCLGRVNVETGKVELLEVPVGVKREAGKADEQVFGQSLTTEVNDSAGQDLAQEDRSRTDGWEIPAFFGTPTAVGDVLYMTSMVGVVYVLDAKAPVFDEHALLAVADLGPLGKTWSLSSLSYSHGRLYDRTSSGVVCIAEKP